MNPKLATPEDFDSYYELRCDESNILWTGHNRVPDKEGLRGWYLENIKKEGRYFFLFF